MLIKRYWKAKKVSDKRYKGYSKTELLEMIIQLSKDNQELKEQNKKLQSQLDNRTIIIENAGSLAEASLKLNGVFKAADEAVAQYVENIKQCNARCIEKEKKTQEECEKIIDEARATVKQTMNEFFTQNTSNENEKH